MENSQLVNISKNLAVINIKSRVKKGPLETETSKKKQSYNTLEDTSRKALSELILKSLFIDQGSRR